jgi:hypothetical protein
VFDIFNLDQYKYYNYQAMRNICLAMGLQMVPLESKDMIFRQSLEDLLIMAKGNYNNTNNRKEGIVIRTMIEKSSIANKGRMSFKVVNNEYLLKDED